MAQILKMDDLHCLNRGLGSFLRNSPPYRSSGLSRDCVSYAMHIPFPAKIWGAEPIGSVADHSRQPVKKLGSMPCQALNLAERHTFVGSSIIIPRQKSSHHKDAARRSIIQAVHIKEKGSGGSHGGQPPPLNPGSQGQGGDMSYLGMWKAARERKEDERKKQDEEQIKARLEAEEARRNQETEARLRSKREQQFASILSVPSEERDRVERALVLDRAAAAIAAANAALEAANEGRRTWAAAARERSTAIPKRSIFLDAESGGSSKEALIPLSTSEVLLTKKPGEKGGLSKGGGSSAGVSGRGAGKSLTLGEDATPGPDFWSWSPPEGGASGGRGLDTPMLKKAEVPKAKPQLETMVLDRPIGLQSLSLPLQSQVQPESSITSLPPLQSILDVASGQEEGERTRQEQELAEAQAEQAIQMPEGLGVLEEAGAAAESGVDPDGTRWWKETGTEERENGEVCVWTVVRGVSADGAVEWENKWWEVSDEFDFKELGAEKSGRDAYGAVWRETWKEAMWNEAKTGLPHIERSADKWGRAADGAEWHEKWYEHYDATNKVQKNADKWAKLADGVDPEPGHASIWHERWGEDFDGRGGAVKWTDRWAERFEADGSITKWGDKWDEKFDRYGRGQKLGETWNQGAGGSTSRTWGENHFGNGQVQKFGQSTEGEHWDVTESMDTWYETKAHFGFQDCFNQSYKLRQVGRKKKQQL